MDYRDERDALRCRVESLEEQLAATKKELAAAQEPPAHPSTSSAAKEPLIMKRLNRVRALFGFRRTTLPARLGVPVAFAPEQGHLGRRERGFAVEAQGAR